MSTILGIFEKVCLDFFPLAQSGFQNASRVVFDSSQEEVADILYIATVITHVCVFAALQDFTALKLFSNPVIFLCPSGGVLKSSSSTKDLFVSLLKSSSKSLTRLSTFQGFYDFVNREETL